MSTVRLRWLVVLAFLAVLSALLAVRSLDETPGSSTVPRSHRIPVPWAADDKLYLGLRTVPATGVNQLVQVGDAVAYGTEKDVVLVDPAGKSTTLSHQSYVGPLAGSGEQGWLAWVDPRKKAPQLVVYDAARKVELGRLDLLYRGSRWGRLDDGPHPLSIDGGRVYYAGEDGDWSWAPGDRVPVRLGPAETDVLDVRSGYRLQHTWTGADHGWTGVLDLVGKDGETSFPGDFGRLSPGALFVSVRSQKLGFFHVGSRAAVELDLPARPDSPGAPPDFLTNYAFADRSEVVIATGGRLLPPPTETMGTPFRGYATWDLSTCSLTTGRCSTWLDATENQPVLPH